MEKTVIALILTDILYLRVTGTSSNFIFLIPSITRSLREHTLYGLNF